MQRFGLEARPGSAICTCRPNLTHAIEECIVGAQQGGVGLIAYSREEGRALGEVTKFLVDNARKRQEKRQEGGDRADKSFLRTECVAGLRTCVFKELMPDVLHWLGITKIHRLVSMSNDAMAGADHHRLGDAVSTAPSDVPSTAPSDVLRAPLSDGRDSLTLLRHPGTVRARCRAVLVAVEDGRSPWFRIERSRLPAVAERVAALTRKRFPDLKVPPHSRWRHFEAGGIDRKAELDALIEGRSVGEAARARIDLTVVSVLLDAGAGPAWRYTDVDGSTYTRSEGLGIATLRAFMAGRFSAIEGQPLRADAGVLARLDATALSNIFQVSASNPLVGLEGRAALLARLGEVLAAPPVTSPWPQRPGQLYDRLCVGGTPPAAVSAAELLIQVLALTNGIFTQGVAVMGRPVGDVWTHRWAGAAVAGGGEDPVTIGVVPFHKLSQWLSYSLLEPLAWAGIAVGAAEDGAEDRAVHAELGLTGLPEYRNGGLLLDGGVIVPRDARLTERRFKPGDEAIVEWRALTVALLDELAVLVRAQLGRSAAELPLASILEGGTWAAGGEIALELREGGLPPFNIESDGTVF